MTTGPMFKVMSRTVRNVLAVAVLGVTAIAMAYTPQSAEAGTYYLWACGSDDNESGSYESQSSIWSLNTNTNPSSELMTGRSCPSKIVTGEVQKSGLHSWVNPGTCDETNPTADYRCFPAWTAGAWSRMSFTTPPGTTLYQAQIFMGARSVIKRPSFPGLSYPQWIPAITQGSSDPFSASPARIPKSGTDEGAYYQWNDNRKDYANNCSGPGSYGGAVSCIWQMEQYIATYGTYGGSAESNFSFNNPTQFNIDLRCRPKHDVAPYQDTRCPVMTNDRYTDGDYAGRLNLRATRMRVEDPTGPTGMSLGNYGGMAAASSDQVFRLTQSVGGVWADDNVGVYSQRLVMLNDSGSVVWDGGTQTNNSCDANRIPGTKYTITWTVKQPCSWSQSNPTSFGTTYGSIDTRGFDDGFYRIQAYATDVPSNTSTVSSNRFIIDNNDEPTDCYRDNTVNAPAGVADSTGKRWIGGTQTVTASVCDSWSGVDRVQFQASVNSGAWSDVPGCNLDVNSARTVSINPSCSYNTVGPAEGSDVRWRVIAYDNSGNAGVYSGASATRYIDNEVPQVGAVSFDVDSADAYRTWTSEPSPAGWTNAEKVTVKWPQVSPGPGSPITGVRFAYRSAPTSACAFSTDDLAATTTRKTVDVPTTGCSEANAQGQHTTYVWARDLVGNEAGNPTSGSVSSKVGTGTFKYDSIAPVFSALTINPGNWSRTNAFQASFDAPSVAAATQSPLLQSEYQVGEGAVKSEADCRLDNGATAALSTRAGSRCTIGSTDPGQNPITAPEGGGDFQLRVWVRDQAGNADRQRAGVGTIKYNDQVCIR